MKSVNRKFQRLNFSFALLFLLVIDSSLFAKPPVIVGNEVRSKGVTHILEKIGNDQVKMFIYTKELDIGNESYSSSYPPPNRRDNSCTYSHTPCSLVTRIEIFINNKEIFVPRAVFADLSDLNTVVTIVKEKDIYIATFSGGDASECYRVKIAFNQGGVVTQEVLTCLDNFVVQSTKFFTPPPL